MFLSPQSSEMRYTWQFGVEKEANGLAGGRKQGRKRDGAGEVQSGGVNVEDLLGHPKNLRAGGVAQWLKMLTPPPPA